jgi:hypothetical protein
LVLRYSKEPNRVVGVWRCHQDVGERSVTERVKDKLEYVKSRRSTPSFGFSSLLLFLPFFLRLFSKIVKSDYYLPHACLSVQLEQLGYYWKDFHKNWNLSIFSNVCRENSSFIKIGQNKRYFTWRLTWIFRHIASISFLNE